MAKEDKRTTAGVDENVIHNMMEGDLPRRMKEVAPVAVPAPPAEDKEDESLVPPRPRKRREQRGYEELFLTRMAPVARKHTYISLESYRMLNRILPGMADGLTIPNFLDNLLAHHFEMYRDEINELYNKSSNPL